MRLIFRKLNMGQMHEKSEFQYETSCHTWRPRDRVGGGCKVALLAVAATAPWRPTEAMQTQSASTSAHARVRLWRTRSRLFRRWRIQHMPATPFLARAQNTRAREVARSGDHRTCRAGFEPVHINQADDDTLRREPSAVPDVLDEVAHLRTQRRQAVPGSCGVLLRLGAVEGYRGHAWDAVHLGQDLPAFRKRPGVKNCHSGWVNARWRAASQGQTAPAAVVAL